MILFGSLTLQEWPRWSKKVGPDRYIEVHHLCLLGGKASASAPGVIRAYGGIYLFKYTPGLLKQICKHPYSGIYIFFKKKFV